MRPLLREVREEMGLDPDPLSAYVKSGYAGKVRLYRDVYSEEDEETVATLALASSLRAKGDLVAARDVDEPAVTTAHTMFGDDAPTTLDAANSLA